MTVIPKILARFLFAILVFTSFVAQAAHAESLASFLPDIDPAELAPGADHIGPVRDDLAVAPVQKSR